MRKLFIILAAVAFAFTFTAPAAAEVNFSGFVAFQTYLFDVDNPGAQKDSSDLNWTMDQVCTRLSANFKEGPVTGYVELRPLAGAQTRHWWATWNFGAGTFGIGQTWTPDFSCITGANYGCGAMTPIDPGCTARAPMAMLTMGGLKIAAIDPNLPAVHPVAGYTDWETSLPKLNVAYNLNVAMVGLKLFGGYQTIADRNVTTDQTQDIDSYVYGITASMGFGPLTVKAMVYMAQNFAEYSAGTAYNYAAFWDGTKICDEEFMAYGVNLAYKVSDTLALSASYVAGESEIDRPGTYEDETSHYHVNATFTMAKGVTITPEFLVLDRGDQINAGVKTEQAVDTRYGVYWKIAF